MQGKGVSSGVKKMRPARPLRNDDMQPFHPPQVYKLFTDDRSKAGSKQSITAFFKPAAAK